MINTAAKLTDKDIERIRMETADECYKEYQDLNMSVWNFFNHMKDWKAGKKITFEEAEKFRNDSNKFIGKIQDILNAVEWTVMKQKLPLSDIEQWYREFQKANKKNQNKL